MISIFKKGKSLKTYLYLSFSALTLGVLYLGGMHDAYAATTGTLVQNTADNLPSFTKLISAISYVMGAMAVAVGVYKARDWSNSPQQTKISEPFKFLGAGGLLVAAPAFAAAITNTIGIDSTVDGMEASGASSLGRTDVFQAVGGANGLDAMVVALMQDITGPMMNLLLAFAYVAGAILVVVGLNRLTKSAQEGPRGPSGLGTMGTFLTAAVLLSASQVMNTFSQTIFGSSGGVVAVYTDIMGITSSAVPIEHAENVISAILVFMIIVGTISFLRGIFVLRGFAEGNSQMTLMGGLSHIIAGILAVNLGQFINVVQNTLGISPAATGVSITFS